MGWMVALLARYLLNEFGEVLYPLHRHRGAAQFDRPLVVLSCTAEARGSAMSKYAHIPEHNDGVDMILSRGLFEPHQRLRVVHIDTKAFVVHMTDLILAPGVTRLSTDLVCRHRPCVVDRYALAPVVDGADDRCCSDVALVWSGVV